MPTFRHGKGSYFQMDNSAGSLVDISSYINSVTLPRSVDTAETSAFGTSAKSYIMGLNDATASIEGMFDATIDAQIAGVISALDAGTLATASIVFGPEGSGTGRIKYTAEIIVTKYEVKTGVGDVVSFSLEGQVTGGVTRTTF